MYGKYLLVLVAVFAAVQGYEEYNKISRKEKIQRCQMRYGYTDENLYDVYEKEQWCESRGNREVSECILEAYGAWNNGRIDISHANPENYEKAKYCAEYAEQYNQDLRACAFMNCSKRVGLGRDY